MKINVLIVDDSNFFQNIIKDVLHQIPQIHICGTASTGKSALNKISTLQPNLVLLDFDMPEMNGLETLYLIRNHYPEIQVIMISNCNEEGARLTIDALNLGALDFITKPILGSSHSSIDILKAKLDKLLPLLSTRFHLQSSLERLSHIKANRVSPKNKSPRYRQESPALKPFRADVVAIGISTGGPEALSYLIPQLPANLRVPVIIVQHMPEKFTNALARSLNRESAVNVVEASQGMIIKAGTVYIAPGDKQMRIARVISHIIAQLTDDPPENGCRPSADYLFRSIPEIYGGHALGIIMTGMGGDGSLGLARMKRYGCRIIGQNKETCTVYGMPKQAYESGLVDFMVPLDQIHLHILNNI